MPDKKIIIRPGFKTPIKIFIKLIANRLQRPVEISGILLKNVMRRQINAPAKPAHRLFAFNKRRRHFEITDIHVDDGNHWVIGMDNNRQARSKKIFLLYLQRVFNRIRKPAMYGGKVDPAFFNYIAVLNDPRTPPAPAFTLPYFFFK